MTTALAVMFLCADSFAQVGINTSNPNPKSALDIISKNNNSGVLFPRLTTEQRDAINPSPTDASADGLWVYNTDNKCYEYWNRSRWVSLCGDSNDVPPLSNVKLLSYEQDGTFVFATDVFKDFFNSYDNFGPFPASTIHTDGSSLVPERRQYTEFSTLNFQNYNIIGVSFRPGVDLTTAEINALVAFANTSKKHLYFFTEGFTQAGKLNLISQLIGDITITSGDLVGSVGTNGDTNAAGPCYYITSDPLNAPFVNGPFGSLQAGVHRFVDHASSSNSFSYAKLKTSSNVQIIAADGLIAGVPQPTSKVGVFKIKNKNVFVITDGAPFYGGTANFGPACMTDAVAGGSRGRKPIKCASVSTNGTDSGVSILMANIIAWSLKNI